MRSVWQKAFRARQALGLAVTFLLMVGAATPVMAQERLEQDFGVIRGVPATSGGCARTCCQTSGA